MSRSQRHRNDEARIARREETRRHRRDSRHALRALEGPIENDEPEHDGVPAQVMLEEPDNESRDN